MVLRLLPRCGLRRIRDTSDITGLLPGVYLKTRMKKEGTRIKYFMIDQLEMSDRSLPARFQCITWVRPLKPRIWEMIICYCMNEGFKPSWPRSTGRSVQVVNQRSSVLAETAGINIGSSPGPNNIWMNSMGSMLGLHLRENCGLK